MHPGTIENKEAIRGIGSSLKEKGCTLKTILLPFPLMKTI
jgi:hypothetical protein